MSTKKIIFGFHAVITRLRYNPSSIEDIYIDDNRRDKRMIDFIKLVDSNKIKLIHVNNEKLDKMANHRNHQGIICVCNRRNHEAHNLDDILDSKEDSTDILLLILDGITDPHNLGACLRTASAAGVDAVIAPRDRCVGITETVEKVSCGASQLIPYIMVTNLARTIRDLKDRNIFIIGTDSKAKDSIYNIDAKMSLAFAMGSENQGLRRLTRELCDKIIKIPIIGKIESLNVSVSSAICLYEAMRQRI